MVDPDDSNLDTLLATAARFEARAVPAGARRAALPPSPSRRLDYLGLTAARDRARAAVAEAEAAGAPASPADTIAELANERIIGQSDLFGLDYLELALAVARGVARVRLAGGSGTGFLVGPGLLMTNHHVLPNLGAVGTSQVQFDYQETKAGELHPEVFTLDGAVFVTELALDFTIVAVAERAASGRAIGDYPWTRLIETLGKVEEGEAINIVEHPLGGTKQIAFRNNQVLSIPEGKPDFLYYTTDTQPGSSGSPCFNDQWELVALHHRGVARTENGQVLRRDGQPFRKGVDPAASIDWIANEGARVSAMVAALRGLRLSGRNAEARDQVLNTTPPNPVELARRHGPPRRWAGGRREMARSDDVTTNGYVNVTVRISGSDIEAIHIDRLRGDGASAEGRTPAPVPLPTEGGAAADPATSPVGEDGALVETTAIDPNWKSRKGYASDFLGTAVPLPKLSDAQKKLTVEVPPEYRKTSGDRYLLHYHHYSLAFHAKRRLAWFSAANIDGNRMKNFNRGKDRWFIDPRIDDPANPTFQMGEELYAAKNTDRGHLTRFKDVSWGASKEEAVKATNDTFHFTNCSLQVAGFNESRDRWQGLEQFLLEQKASKERRRLSVITGPVFTAKDPRYRNSEMSYTIRIPLSFWKLCALIREDGSLAVTAFVLGQPDAAELPDVDEVFDVSGAQVTVAHLEQLTGLDFGALRDHDHLAEGGDPGTLETTTTAQPIKPLRSFDDIVV